ncbi:Uma2 family endonuclease [Streptomyces sp. NPDC059740]|uniref:Uma2 family endonuclease n=1 Tax=Streptomyces sp. NPDC059740 TaxID=3346926 RepID=UPI00365B0ED1
MSIDYSVLPDGYQVSVFDGEIVLTPQSDTRYWTIESIAFAARTGQVPRARRLSDVLITFPGENDAAPDFVVLADGAEPVPGRKAYDHADVLLTVEVVSQPGDPKDYERNVVKYGRFGVPHYLVADPFRRRVTLFSEPFTAGYGHEETVAYDAGEKVVRLADGTALRLDLADFPVAD